MNQVQIKKMDGRSVIDSRDVAEMTEKKHSNLMRDIARYINDFGHDSKLNPANFFISSSYLDGNGRERPCYLLTKQGCEFVANKMTGTKGNLPPGM